MMWQVRQLEMFATTVAEGSITRAAEKMHVSQPAASKLITTLEHKCGFSLFFRQGNQLTITAEGELLYGEISRLMTSTEEIRVKAAEIREQKFGTLHIAACPSLASRLMPTLAHEFIQSHPSVKPLLTSHSSQFLMDWMAVQKSDLGVSMIAEPRRGLTAERMFRLYGLCVMSKSHRLASNEFIKPQDLDYEPFISLCIDDRTGYDVDQFFFGRETKRHIVAEAQMSTAACQMAAHGTGVAIVDPFSALNFSREYLPAKRLEPAIPFDLWLIYPTRRPLSQLAATFAQHMQTFIMGVLQKHNIDFEAYPLRLELDR